MKIAARFVCLVLLWLPAGCGRVGLNQINLNNRVPASITIAHQREVLGWALKIDAKSGSPEAKLVRASVRVNNQPISDGDPSFSTPLDQWSAEYHQVGTYPNPNTVEVSVYDGAGNETRALSYFK